jgi:hypothetical protein
MYTVEFENEDTIITVLCEKDDQEDVEVIIGADGTTFIRQFQEYKNEYDIITLTYAQLQDILAAINSPEGAFRVKWVTE